jgi:predicted transcriptional regulator
MAMGSTRLGHTLRAAPIKRLFALVLLLSFVSALAPGAAAFPGIIEVNLEISSAGIGPVMVSDIDGDGWNDILLIDDQGNLTIHFQDPLDQDFPFDVTASVDTSIAEGMDVGMLDMDGRRDIVSYTDQSLVLNFQHPARMFEKKEINLSFAPNAIEIGDLNGDLGSDIVLVGDSEFLVIFRDSSLLDFYGLDDNTYGNLTGGDDVALGDFGGSKGLDIAVSSANEVHIFIQESQGLAYGRTIAMNSSYASSSIGAGDFNGDSLDDIVLLRSNNGTGGTIEIYAQDDGGDFTLIQSIENEHIGDEFSIGDINDDELSDISVVSDGGESSALLYVQRERTRSEFSLFSIGNTSAPGGRIGLGELNGDPYEDIVLRTQDTISIFYQDDFPPFSNHIPSRIYFNENTVGDNLIKLDDYIKDDHSQLQYAVIYESDPDLLHAVIDGVYLDFYPKENWVGIARFKVAGWDGDYIIHSNKFIVGVNDVPDVLSYPVKSGEIGEEYLYEMIVEDRYPESDRVRFELAWGPEGMDINPFTGEITWTPEEGGDYKVAIFVTDNYGGKTEQSFVINVVEEESFPMGIVLGGATITALILLIGAFMAWNESAKFGFLMLIVPLYSKIKREKILDHFVRGKIYGYILANPGEHYNAIREVLALTNGSLAHHLRTLEREGFIKSKRFGIYRRFYPMNMQIPAEEFETNEVQRTIMGIIKKSPGISQKEIASTVNLTPPTVNYHIGILNHEGLVHVTRNGRQTECYLEV